MPRVSSCTERPYILDWVDMLSVRVQEILAWLTGLIFLLVLSRSYFLDRLLGLVAAHLLKKGSVKWAMRFKGWSDPAFKRKQRCHK